jgi:excisionase family DNA binding protein
MATERNGIRAMLSPTQIASACGLSRRAVYRAIGRGELPAARLCNRLRVKPDDFERWVETMIVLAPKRIGDAGSRTDGQMERGSLRALFDPAKVSGDDTE